MIIILEGPDGSGKTTQAGAVTAQFRRESPGSAAVSLNAGPPDPADRDPFEEYELGLADGTRGLPPETLVTCDRWALGEAVYGPLLRGKSRLSPGGLLHCEMMFSAMGALRWMMMPSLPALIKVLQQRGDSLIDTEDLTHIRQAYAYLAPRYCYTQIGGLLDETVITAALKAAFAKAERAREIAAAAPGYIGAQYPGMVLAGDMRSSILKEDPYTAAFTPARAGASVFLMDALATASRSVMKHAGILNTGEPGMGLAEADRVLGSPRWVALGGEAGERLTKAHIAHAAMRHPSYERRFRRTERTPQEYALQLLTAGGVTR